MLKSMTGFGKSVCELLNKKFTIEIKSLNSKQLDINAKLPILLKSKDLIIRNEISRLLERGKIDINISAETNGTINNFCINKDVVINYYNQLEIINDKLNINSKDNLLEIIMKLPDTIKNEENEVNEEEWTVVYNTISKAINELNDYRLNEGKILESDLISRIKLIVNMINDIENLEGKRIEYIKNRIKQNMHELIENNNFDKNRFEQELIYYIEKIDITEEKVRLKNHCNYFIETVNAEESQGKKLGFICQEIGREINTLGSKANDSDMQKIVIQMKDELEKIKEQLLNVL